jgi:chemotaxis signal transduction protein
VSALSSGDALDVEALRRQFDAAFARPVGGTVAAAEEILAIRVAGDSFAIRVRDLSGLAKRPPLTTLPNRTRALLGLVGIHGVVVPVFSVAELLGYDTARLSQSWLVLHGIEEPVAFAFEAVDGYRRAPREAFCQATESHAEREHIVEAVRLDTALCPVLELGSIRDALAARPTDRPVGKER